MSTPFPLEERQELDSASPQWDPWKGPGNPGFFAGMGFNDETAELGPAYRVLEAAGSGAAKGEALLAGIWNSEASAASKYAAMAGLPKTSKFIQEQFGSTYQALQDDAKQRVAAMTPDPATVGGAVNMMRGVVEPLTLAALGGSVGGLPLAMTSVGGGEGLSTYQERRAQGVGAGTAAAEAALTGVSSAAGLLLPAGIGSGLLTRMASGAAMQAGFGLANRYADHAILEAGGYHDMASQQKVWDGQQMLTDAILGGAFGAAHQAHPPARVALRDQPGIEDAALTASLAGADRRSAPGVAADPGAANAHDAALRAAMADVMIGKPVDVSASGVGDHTFIARRDPDLTQAENAVIDDFKQVGFFDHDGAIQQLEAVTRPIERSAQLPAETTQPSLTADDIPRAAQGALTPAQREIESRFAQQIAFDRAAAEGAYNARPDAEGGRVINTDIAREVSPDYLADRSQSAAVHEPASFLAKGLYTKRLAESARPGEAPVVLMTAGGTGAGKTSAIKQWSAKQEAAGTPKPQIIFDTNLNKASSAKPKIDEALAAGKKVIITYVSRDPVDALVNGALKRAMRQEGELGSGRTVPVEEHAATHVGSNEAIRELADHYAGNPNVEIRILDNNHGPGQAREIPLSELPKLAHNQVREKVNAALEAERAAGRISESVYRGFAGATGGEGPKPGGIRSVIGRARELLGAKPQPEPESERSGADTGQLIERVATATGRTIEVAPKLVEASDLVTSDQKKYPQELQPRQRGERKALDAQVLDIAKNLAPERLGSSAEADRGAPITGEGNVVESGNGRVMALRRVYEENGEKADAYRRFLQAQGYDLEGYKNPILIRERVTPMDMGERRAFALEANQAATAELAPVERAQADARLIDSSTMAKLAGADLTQFKNADFVRDFIAGLPQSEHSAMLNPDGTVSQAGVRRIQAAILAKAYGGNAQSNVTLGRILESTNQDLKSTLNALIDAAPVYARLRQMIDDGVIGKEYDIAPAIIQAVEDVARLRMTGSTLAEHLATSDMFSAKTLATRAFYDKSGTRLVGRDEAAAALRKYADQAMAQRINQGNLFSDTPATPTQLLHAATAQGTGDMFGLRTSQTKATAQERTEVADERAEKDTSKSWTERTVESALTARPNLEIVTDDGQRVPARAALDAVNTEIADMQERASPAVQSAMDCFSRVGT